MVAWPDQRRRHRRNTRDSHLGALRRARLERTRQARQWHGTSRGAWSECTRPHRRVEQSALAASTAPGPGEPSERDLKTGERELAGDGVFCYPAKETGIVSRGQSNAALGGTAVSAPTLRAPRVHALGLTT